MATCIAVGKVSFELYPLFTWSLGCTVLYSISLFKISLALLAITSFIFIFVWVPEPVCQITKGKWSIPIFPSNTSSEALIITSDISFLSPYYKLTFAIALLIKTNDLINIGGIFWDPILKFWSDLCVWAPQYFSAGTSIYPKVSFSFLIFENWNMIDF